MIVDRSDWKNARTSGESAPYHQIGPGGYRPVYPRHNVFQRRALTEYMVDAKALLKGAGIVILGFVLISILWTLISILFSAVAWAIVMAIRLLIIAGVLYGIYWGYTTFVADSKSPSREREKVFER